jgi:hypothetical protein
MPPFQMPSQPLRKIEKLWQVKLTETEMEWIGVICRAVIAAEGHIPRSAAITAAKTAAANKRHKRIAEILQRLEEHLFEDERLGGPLLGLDAKRRNAMTSPRVQCHLVPMLRSFRAQAQRPLPSPARGRPKTRTAWDGFLRGLMSVYRSATRQQPTIGWSKSKGYNSRFLRGGLLLHDALPPDVQIRSSRGTTHADDARAILGGRLKILLKVKKREYRR